jgi:peptide/nickel transport system substrate-binding protein
MDERAIRRLLHCVRAGRLWRRGFVRAMVGLGVSAPLVSEMLASVGVAQAQARAAAAPAKRGGGDALKALWWDARRCRPSSSGPRPRPASRSS